MSSVNKTNSAKSTTPAKPSPQPAKPKPRPMEYNAALNTYTQAGSAEDYARGKDLVDRLFSGIGGLFTPEPPKK